jgi:quercetin dioxygenase-like cupin family protein
MQYVRRTSSARTPSASAIFVGQVSSQLLNANPQYRISEVAFAPGGRTKWHTHTFHQVLVITEGRGVVATEDEERSVTPGDVLYIAPGVRHWHGAADDTAMAHLSLNGAGETHWEPLPAASSGSE